MKRLPIVLLALLICSCTDYELRKEPELWIKVDGSWIKSGPTFDPYQDFLLELQRQERLKKWC